MNSGDMTITYKNSIKFGIELVGYSPSEESVGNQEIQGI